MGRWMCKEDYRKGRSRARPQDCAFLLHYLRSNIPTGLPQTMQSGTSSVTPPCHPPRIILVQVFHSSKCAISINPALALDLPCDIDIVRGPGDMKDPYSPFAQWEPVYVSIFPQLNQAARRPHPHPPSSSIIAPRIHLDQLMYLPLPYVWTPC